MTNSAYKCYETSVRDRYHQTLKYGTENVILNLNNQNGTLWVSVINNSTSSATLLQPIGLLLDLTCEIISSEILTASSWLSSWLQIQCCVFWIYDGIESDPPEGAR